jgi:hypothetical protein
VSYFSLIEKSWFNLVKNNNKTVLPTAAWKLMKGTGLNDIVSRKYPNLVEFLVNSTATNQLMFHWPKTRYEGDYCEDTNGYVCQRPAAAQEASEANGNLYINLSFGLRSVCSISISSQTSRPRRRSQRPERSLLF